MVSDFFSSGYEKRLRIGARRHDLIAITDEVYERMVYDAEHVRLATLDGMAERTITISSIGKSFSFTGWKTGWAIAPPDLTAGIRAAHQFLTFTVPNAMQYGSAAALRIDDSYYAQLTDFYRSKRDRLVAGLRSIGLEVYEPQGTYFVLADHTRFGFPDDVAFCRHLIEHVGVAGIPPSAFYHDPADGRALSVAPGDGWRVRLPLPDRADAFGLLARVL